MTAALQAGDVDAMQQVLIANGRHLPLPAAGPFDPKRAAANDRD